MWAEIMGSWKMMVQGLCRFEVCVRPSSSTRVFVKLKQRVGRAVVLTLHRLSGLLCVPSWKVAVVAYGVFEV